MSVWDT